MTNWQAQTRRPVAEKAEVEEELRFANVESPTKNMREQLAAAKDAVTAALPAFSDPVNVLAAGHASVRDNPEDRTPELHVHIVVPTELPEEPTPEEQ